MTAEGFASSGLTSFFGVGDAGVRRAVFSVFGVASSIWVNSSSEEPSDPSVLILGAGTPLASASLDVDCGAGTVGGGVSGSSGIPSSAGVSAPRTLLSRASASASSRILRSSSSLSCSSRFSRSKRSSSLRISLCILCVRFLKLSSELKSKPNAVMTSNMWTKSAVCPSDGVKPQSTKNRSVSGSTLSGSISWSHRPNPRSCREVRGLMRTIEPTVAPRSSSQNSDVAARFFTSTFLVTCLPSSSVPATSVASASAPYLSTCRSCSFLASFTTSSATTTTSSSNRRKNSPDAHSGALTP